MTRDYTIIVSGFGRCGSSLVMQMLQAGGVQVTGEYPAFEDTRYSLEQQKAPVGVAIKVLDPHKFIPQSGKYRWIWVDRDHNEQAKSQIKFAREVVGICCGDDAVQKFANSYKEDRPVCMDVIQQLGGPLLKLRFENVIREPSAAALKIANFVDATDSRKMARVVRERPTGCLPYFLELELLANAMEPPQ